MIQAIFSSGCHALHLRTWRRRFLHLQGFDLLQFSTLFEQSNTVYVLLLPLLEKRGWNHMHGALFHRRRFYIGSTAVSAHSRQDARLRKYRLLQRGDFCNAELMLHYFHTHGDLFQAVLIPVHCYDTLHQARASEYSLIHSWKPQLNAPWIVRLNPTSTTRFTQPFTVKSCYGSPGKRLWLKVRRKVRTLGLLRLYDNTLLEPHDHWLLLMNIANRGIKAFQAEKRLRSAEFHNHQISALYRLCNLLDDPPQTAVRAVLRRILTFRQCAIPKGPKPLVLPLLAHDSVQSTVEQWISNITIDSKDYMIPFHLPHKKCVAGKHRSLRDIIYNNIAIVEHWHWILRHHAIVQSFDYNIHKLRSLMVILLHLCHFSAFPSAFVDYCSTLWVRSFFRIFTAISMSHGLKCSVGCFTTMYSLSVFKIGKHLCSRNGPTTSMQFHSIEVQGCSVNQALITRSFHTWRDHAITHGHAFCPQFVWQTYKKTIRRYPSI